MGFSLQGKVRARESVRFEEKKYGTWIWSRVYTGVDKRYIHVEGVSMFLSNYRKTTTKLYFFSSSSITFSASALFSCFTRSGKYHLRISVIHRERMCLCVSNSKRTGKKSVDGR